MKKHEELVVITKTYDLILWSCNHTGRFPRQHRFVLGDHRCGCRRTAAGIARLQDPEVAPAAGAGPKTRGSFSAIVPLNNPWELRAFGLTHHANAGTGNRDRCVAVGAASDV